MYFTRLVLLLLVASVIGSISSQTVCQLGEFPYSHTGECQLNSCPGQCIDNVCCVKECFDITNMSQFRENCHNVTGNTTCSRFTGQMQCLADISNSTADICTQQVYQHSERNLFTGNFNPADCPCTEGYMRLKDVNSFVLLYCQTDGYCYLALDEDTNSTARCLNKTLQPEASLCFQNETMGNISAAFLMPCSEYCSGTCRQHDVNAIQTCCVDRTVIRDQSDDGDQGPGLQVGHVILIAVSVIVVITVLLFGLLYCSRFKKIFRQDQSIAGLTDLGDVKPE